MTDPRTATQVIADAIFFYTDDSDTRAASEIIDAIHAAGFMIVPRVPTPGMWRAAMSREGCDDDVDAYNDIYRAMTEAGELK